jgi:hypothetical protein
MDRDRRFDPQQTCTALFTHFWDSTLGQLILDPVKAIPVSEMWLYENPKALASVKKGLKESAEGKSVYRGSFGKHAKDRSKAKK